MKLNFLYDWQDSVSEVRLESHRSTWANLSIGIDDRFFTENLSSCSDEEGGNARNFISVSVFPLAEFIAANWWPLLHEPLEKESLLKDTTAFKLRHWINKHTDGFAYPTLGIFGSDSSVRIVARPSYIESANIEFPGTSGKINMSWEGIRRDEVEATLLSFITATEERLPANSDKNWLKDIIARIQHSRADHEEAIYCRCAGLLGADPYDPSDELYNAITKTVDLLGEELAVEMFATAETSDVVSRVLWIQENTHSTIKKSRETATYANGLKNEILTGSLKPGRPWERGYNAAQQLRSLLHIMPDDSLTSIDAVTKALLDAPAKVISNIKNMESICGARGVACKSTDGLGLAITQNWRDQKFQLVATFADFLFSKDNEIFLSTGASTDRQKCNRAFAAEFLAPIQGIMEKWSNSESIEANQEKIAQSFGVSTYIVRYQIQNQAEHLLAA